MSSTAVVRVPDPQNPDRVLEYEAESPEYEAEVKRVRDELLRNTNQADFERALIEGYKANAAMADRVYRDWECTIADGLDGLEY